MKRAIFASLAVIVLASSTGCCCLEQLFCRPWCCDTGDCCDDCCGGCGGYGGDCCGGGGYGGDYGGGYGGGGCSSCGHGPMASHQHMQPPDVHMYAKRRRNTGGQREYMAGPPTGGVGYPYYTNRGPRDFLARNPRSIGPY